MQIDLQMLKKDRAERLNRLCDTDVTSPEALISLGILFAGCVVAESLDRLAMAVSELNLENKSNEST